VKFFSDGVVPSLKFLQVSKDFKQEGFGGKARHYCLSRERLSDMLSSTVGGCDTRMAKC